MKRFGIEWSKDFDQWSGKRGRAEILIWPFGSIFQCKVIIEDVGVGLPVSKTRDEAMKRGIAWLDDFEANGVPSVGAVFKSCYENWKTIYQTRTDVLDHLLFTIGNGYKWLDGAIFNTTPYDHLERSTDKLEFGIDEIITKWEELRKEVPSLPELNLQREKDIGVGPFPDMSIACDFYPVTPGYSNICRIPDNVTDEWLEVCYEAALMLRDRADVGGLYAEGNKREYKKTQESNARIGAALVKEIETRFGSRLRKHVQSYQELVQAQT